MHRVKLLILTITFFSFTSAKGGESISSKDLAGNWQIVDVKITNQSAAKPVTTDNCYLCDLYKAKLGLVFTSDGKVNYSNYGNPNVVEYTVNGNVLSLFTKQNGESQTPETSQQFTVSLKDNILTLTRVYPEFTETYTLTK
jgi:hypothetical protein